MKNAHHQFGCILCLIWPQNVLPLEPFMLLVASKTWWNISSLLFTLQSYTNRGNLVEWYSVTTVDNYGQYAIKKLLIRSVSYIYSKCRFPVMLVLCNYALRGTSWQSWSVKCSCKTYGSARCWPMIPHILEKKIMSEVIIAFCGFWWGPQSKFWYCWLHHR